MNFGIVEKVRHPFLGSIDLSGAYIKTDGLTVWEYKSGVKSDIIYDYTSGGALKQVAQVVESFYLPDITTIREGTCVFVNDPTNSFGKQKVGGEYVDLEFCKIGKVYAGVRNIEEVETYPFNTNGFEYNNSSAIVDLGMPDYSRQENMVLPTTGYIAEFDLEGFVGGLAPAQNVMNVIIDGVLANRTTAAFSQSYTMTYFRASKGSLIKATTGVSTSQVPVVVDLLIYPLKGV